MERTITLNGDVFQGTDLEILEAMRASAFFASASARDYAQIVLDRARELCPNLPTTELPDGAADSEVAARLLSALVESGLAQEYVPSKK